MQLLVPSANFLCLIGARCNFSSAFWCYEASNTRSRIHERTFSLRFLGIILRVLKLDVSVWISQTIGMGVWFLSGFPSFSFTVYVQ
jgi:hypothetical protein